MWKVKYVDMNGKVQIAEHATKRIALDAIWKQLCSLKEKFQGMRVQCMSVKNRTEIRNLETNECAFWELESPIN